MKYCIDSSALIGLGERHYPERIDVFSPIWKDLYKMIDKGKLVSVDMVKIELERKADDWRSKFLAKANGMFQIDESIEQEYAEVIADIEGNAKCPSNKHRERFMIGADPWLIAYARSVDDCTVISEEKKSLNSYGLGEVCKELGVQHMDLLEFFEKRKIGKKKSN